MKTKTWIIGGLILDLIATIIMVSIVIVIHTKITSTVDDNTTEVTLTVDNFVGPERALLITALCLYVVSFGMFIYAEHKSNNKEGENPKVGESPKEL